MPVPANHAADEQVGLAGRLSAQRSHDAANQGEQKESRERGIHGSMFLLRRTTPYTVIP